MAFWNNLFRRPEPVRAPTPTAGAVLSGRPTYASSYAGAMLLPRATSDRLLSQFRANVPVVKRATEILAGFVGLPVLEVEGSEAETAWLADWADHVEYGSGTGGGLAVWQNDLIIQALTYGFAGGEAEIAPDRSGVKSLWAYLSPSLGFRSDDLGSLTMVQSAVMGGERVLNPDTSVRVTHGPLGCNPHGESMLLALPMYCQALIDVVHAHRETWRRNGIPVYHVNWEPAAGFDDPSGAVSGTVRQALADAWDEAMRSQAVDGKAKDFYSTGAVTVTVIGADGAVMDVQLSTRVLLEQIVAATGIPPFMFGLSWASTERMSKQQADMLMQTIDCVRREIEGAIRKVVDLHVRLSGRRGALNWTLRWPDVSLQDQVQTAQAANLDAQAAIASQKFWRQLWADGVIDQLQYAAEVAGLQAVAVSMDEPPAMRPEPEQAQSRPQDGGTDANSLKAIIASESMAEYPQLAACNGRH